MANNNDGQIVLGLDIPKTVSQINVDIKKLQNQLEQVKATGALDTSATVKQINAQIASLQSQLKNIELKANINTGNITNQSQQVGQQIGNNIAQGISSGVNKAKSELKSFSDLTNFSELNKKIEHLQIDPSALKNYSAILDEVKTKYAEFGQVKITNEQFNNGVLEKFKVNIEQVNGDLKETKSFMMALNDDKDTFVFDGIIKGSESVVQHLDKTKNAVNQTADAINALKDKAQADKIQLSMGVNGDTTSKIEVLRNNFTKLGLSADEVKTKMSGVDTEVKTLQSLMNSGADNSAIVTQFEKLQTVLTQTQNNLKQTRSDYSLLATEQQRLSLANTIEAWNQKNTRATKEVRAENDRYVASLRDLNTQMTKLQFGQIQTGFKQTENSMRTLNRLGASLKDQMKQAANSFTQWISVSSAIMGVVYNTKQAVSELKDLDDILTEISKTSDLTTEQLKNLGDTAFDTASKYGKKASDYLTGVQEMYRAGFDNAEQMAELSVLAQSAGDMDATLSNNYLMATNAAYKYKGSIEDLNNVLDSQNYITNNAAISMKDIADATTETASVAAEFGVQIDELSALIATATANTRESGSEVGTALKAILINLQDTTSKPVTDTFDALGISMTKVVDGAEKLKTPIELLYELADAYNSLPEGDVMRANILNDIGQKRHANVLASILSDMSGYQKMLDLYNSTSANGSAFKEAEKSSNNLTGSLNRLSNTWTDTVENIVNSDTLKGAVNLLNSLLSGVNKLTDALGSLGTIGLGAGIFAGIKNIGRPKMFGLYKYADINMCSLGY